MSGPETAERETRGTSRIVLTVLGGLLGLAVGAALGFAMALWIAEPRNDGTFAMREILVCVPLGILAGIVAGVWWGVKSRLFA